MLTEFGSGFSVTNLKFMRQFYLLNAHRISQTVSDLFETSKNRIGQAASDLLAASEKRPFSLSWSHYVLLLGIKKTDERDFYEIEAASQNWTRPAASAAPSRLGCGCHDVAIAHSGWGTLD